MYGPPCPQVEKRAHHERHAECGPVDDGADENEAPAKPPAQTREEAWAGLEPDYRISSTDANYPISIGVPAITLSRGGISKDSHSPAESWENVDSHLSLQIVMLTLLAEAGIAADQ